MRLLGYLAVGIAIGCLVVYTPAIEFLPAWVMDAVGLAYFGSLGLAITIGLPVAIAMGVIQSLSKTGGRSSENGAEVINRN